MKYRILRVNSALKALVAMTAVMAASSAWAGSSATRGDKAARDHTKPAVAKKDSRTSNWPALPERQAGQSYGKVIVSPFGARERNFESGRR